MESKSERIFNDYNTWIGRQSFFDAEFRGRVTHSGGTPYYDVRGFGATGDGSTNDGPAIQAAIDAASTNPIRRRVYVPQGRYVCTAQLQGRMGVTLFGDSPTSSGATYYGSVILNNSSGYTIAFEGLGTSWAGLRDICLVAGTPASGCIKIHESNEVIVDHCRLYGVSVPLVYCTDSIACIFRDIHFGGSGVTYGFHFAGNFANGMVVENVYGGASTAGILFAPTTYPGQLLCINALLEANGGPGIIIQPTAGSGVLQVNFYGGWFEANVTADIDINPTNINQDVYLNLYGTNFWGSGATGYCIRNGSREAKVTAIGCNWGIGSYTGGVVSDGSGLIPAGVTGDIFTDAWMVKRLRAPVIATASLPAAGAAQDGTIIIEDNGAGDRNLILYAGGQRFRIDGGAAI